jgi:16S rRNA (cytosine1402-N4)-methyltransferase
LTSTGTKESNFFHRPVLADEVSRLMINRRDGIYIDLTVGGGGHLKYLSERLFEGAQLIGVDRDPEAVAAAEKNLRALPQKVLILNRTFDRLDDIAGELAIREFDGILMDLGVSSHQIDSPERGFSFMHNGPLDMRMGDDSPKTAVDVINEYPEKELALIFKKYGESKIAVRAAAAICRSRQKEAVRTTTQLRDILSPLVSQKYMAASLAQIFQALRIEINGELDQLADVLPMAVNRLRPGGRLAVIAYHSLEDRLVKRFFIAEERGCICPPKIPVCVCGRLPTIRRLTKRVVKPSSEEIKENSRSRSARLRVVEKIT